MAPPRSWTFGSIGHNTGFLGARIANVRSLLIASKGHRITGSPLSARTHVRRIADQFSQRHEGADHQRAGASLHAFNPAATEAQVSHNDDRKVLRRDHFNQHERFQNDWVCLAGGFLEGHRSSYLESHFVRVLYMVASVVKNSAHANHLAAR